MHMRTQVAITHSPIAEVHTNRVLHALDKAERDIDAAAHLQGLEMTGEAQVVDQEHGIVEFDEVGCPRVRSVRTMTDDEIADWLDEHRQALPPLLILTFEASVAPFSAAAAAA